MEAIRNRMNPWEHCPDCGGLLVRLPGTALCPHCGCEVDELEERMFAPLARLFEGHGEPGRFHLADDCLDEVLEDAA